MEVSIVRIRPIFPLLSNQLEVAFPFAKSWMCCGSEQSKSWSVPLVHSSVVADAQGREFTFDSRPFHRQRRPDVSLSAKISWIFHGEAVRLETHTADPLLHQDLQP